MNTSRHVGALLLALGLFSATGALAKGAGVTVTLATGKVEATSAGKVRLLAKGGAVAEGDTIETAEGARLELALPDGSKLRLAEKTKVTLTRGHFEAGGARNVGVGLLVGRVWAKVAKAVSGGDSFEVETRNAVAGVRGTSFAVQAAQDLSAVVRVYAGTVGVRKSAGGAAALAPGRERKQIPGPERIDKKQWEEVIATAMKQVRVSAAGELAPAEDFEDLGDDQEWAMWNQKRDLE